MTPKMWENCFSSAPPPGSTPTGFFPKKLGSDMGAGAVDYFNEDEWDPAIESEDEYYARKDSDEDFGSQF